MTTREIKSWIKKNLNLTKIAIRSTYSKNPYFIASVIPNQTSPLNFTYTESFPLEFRELALKSIYGDSWKSLPGREGNAGNVCSHSIGMKESEWNMLIAKWESLKN